MEPQVTAKMKVFKPVREVFEALVDPEKMSNYWFSSGSARWEQGKTITLRYEEYNAVVEIEVTEVKADQKIVFQAGVPGHMFIAAIDLTALDDAATLVAVTQTGWKGNEENLTAQLLDNKEGWVYMLTCLKAYLEFGVNRLRASLVK